MKPSHSVPSFALVALLTFSASVSSSQQKKRVALQPNQRVQIQYGFPAWNKSSEQIDTASIFLRDGNTKKIVQVSLEETAPDSSLFAGVYSVDWGSMDQIQAEFYIPPQNLLLDPKGIKELQRSIEAQELVRKPFIMRSDETGLQVVEVYDNREEALKALELFKKAEGLRLSQEKILKNVNNESLESRDVPTAGVGTARSVLTFKEQARLLKNRAEELRLEQIERQKMAAREKKMKEMGQAQIKKQKAQSALKGQEALKYFNAGNFSKAVELFNEAVELDPENKTYYYQYGVSLYRIDNFPQSLATLRLVDKKAADPIERDYYIALNQYRLKDYEESYKNFDMVRRTGHKELGPSAAFYQGIIDTELKKYPSAIDSFQDVINTSNDPKMDERAEAYIENLIRLQALEKEGSRKWLFAGNVGAIYDTNILLSSTSVRDQTPGQGQGAGYRLLTQGMMSYRPVFNEKLEIEPKFSLLNLKSYDTGFGNSTSLAKADPLLAGFYVPITRKTVAWKKPYRAQFIPGYETLYMSIENDNGTKNNILNSFLLSMNNTIFMSDDWYSSYNIDLRYDNSLLTTAVDDNDPSAFRTKLTYSNMIFVNKAEGRLLIPDLAYTVNGAKGKNNQFNRIDLGINYVFPWIWKASWTARAGYFVVNYPKTDSTTAGIVTAPRVDQNYSLSTGFSKPIIDHWSFLTNATYVINDSNRTANQYNKLTILTSFSFVY